MTTANRTTIIAGVVLSFVISSTAQLLFGAPEEASIAEFFLPGSIEPDSFTDLLENSPFTRVLDFSESLQLTGIAVIDGEQVATVHDREKGRSFVVSTEPNENGWKMVEIDSNADLENVTASFSVNGGEVVTVQFGDEQLNPTGTSSITATNKSKGKPPPTKEEIRKFGGWVRERMSKMTDDQKKQVGQIMQEKMKANPKLTDRQKGEIFVKVLDYVDSGK